MFLLSLNGADKYSMIENRIYADVMPSFVKQSVL